MTPLMRPTRAHPIMQRPLMRELAAILLLVGLWMWFFWRLLTPIAADQASLKLGDFSGQFVAFGAYQYARWTQGEVPLWNPYNNGGLPFIADTQAAVFYPPRLLTIALAHLTGGWQYHTLELEMCAHVLGYTLAMYAFVRVLTRGRTGSRLAGLVAAVVGGYGGFLSGYPPLQLALLEAAVWFPLVGLGAWLAGTGARAHTRLAGVLLAGVALGLSWLAGHPQTSFFLSLFVIPFLTYAHWRHGSDSLAVRLGRFAIGGVGIALLAGGLAAVQLLPGVEYLALTARVGFTFDAKGNGFPFQDVIQVAYPGIVSLFSPLYIGATACVLVLAAVLRRERTAAFWLLLGGIGLLWAFGANSAFFPLLYNTLPGLRFFRGQERAAFWFANAAAVLAGLGMVALLNWDRAHLTALVRYRLLLSRLAWAAAALFALVLVAWLGAREAYQAIISPVAFATLFVLAAALLVPRLVERSPAPVVWLSVLALVVLELFSFNMDADSTYHPVPPAMQLAMQPPALLQPILMEQEAAQPFRVDGIRGVLDNYGSLYGVPDIRGISPLFLQSAYTLLNEGIPERQVWELFAVRYVLTDWNALPVASHIVTTGSDRFGPVNVHELADPRPFALLQSDYRVVSSDTAAYAYLREDWFDARHTVLLAQAPAFASAAGESGSATVTRFEPEHIRIAVEAPREALLSLALLDYPGWRITLDGQPIQPIRAYGAFITVPVPAGSHTVEAFYQPPTYHIGAAVSIITLVAVGVLAAGLAVLSWHGRRDVRD
jgi:hypothetical protein